MLKKYKGNQKILEKTIYIHIGPHKSGTTTIQKGLLLNEDVLKSMGVLIPRSGRSMTETAGHHNLAWELQNNAKFDPFYGTWDDLVREIRNNSNINKVVLSAEGFCSISEQEIEKIGGKLTGHQVKILMYLRNQDQALQSSWVSQVRNRFVMPFVGSFHDWLEENDYRSKNTDYYAMIKRWEKVFSTDSLILSGFSQNFIGENLFTHFLSLCDIPSSGIITPANLNLSPGVKTIEAMRMLKNTVMFSEIDPNIWDLIVKSIVSYGDEAGWNQHKLNYLGRGLSRKIMKHHQQNNKRIENEYFNNHVIFERSLLKQTHIDRFTYDQFSKQEVLDLFAYILGKIDLVL